MRNFVIAIGQYAKSFDNNFIVIPQNGLELITSDGTMQGVPVTAYLDAINGVGREDLFYGYDKDNDATPVAESNYMTSYLDICEQNGIQVLTTDYCWAHNKVDNSYAQNMAKGYISFAAPERELNVIPDYPSPIRNENNSDILSLADAKNFLYLINPSKFSFKGEFVAAVKETNYDVIIMDMFFDGDFRFTTIDIEKLKTKQNGGKRLIIVYMSIGEAEDYRYYWQNKWKTDPPDWLDEENPNWAGNYKVHYWDAGWQSVIYGNDDSYLKKIVGSGFDGVYLDIVDAFEYYEELN